MLARAELYYALSECYKEPVADLARQVADKTLYQVIANGFAALQITFALESLALDGSADQVLEQLKRAYYPLFVIPPYNVLPVESVFKSWSMDGESEILGSSQGYIMGPPAVDMLRRYQARDIAIPHFFKDYPDHLALLLEYGGLLCEEGDTSELAQFVATHLDSWIETFRDEVFARSTDPFYRTVVAATVAFVRYERAQFQIAEVCDA